MLGCCRPGYSTPAALVYFKPNVHLCFKQCHKVHRCVQALAHCPSMVSNACLNDQAHFQAFSTLSDTELNSLLALGALTTLCPPRHMQNPPLLPPTATNCQIS